MRHASVGGRDVGIPAFWGHRSTTLAATDEIRFIVIETPTDIPL